MRQFLRRRGRWQRIAGGLVLVVGSCLLLRTNAAQDSSSDVKPGGDAPSSLAEPASAARPSSATAPSSVAPIVTRQTRFSIPFQVDASDDPELTPFEVLLYVSSDEGKTWEIGSRRSPAAAPASSTRPAVPSGAPRNADGSKTAFDFTAPRDGAYWFSLRSIDRRGDSRPRGPHEPGLKVVVDTAPPQLELVARRGDAGEIVVRWKADDPNLDRRSLKIQYRDQAGSERSWRELAIDRNASERSPSGRSPTGTSPSENSPGGGRPTSMSGEVAWWPTPGAATIAIRADVGDTAGNRTHQQTSIDRASSRPSTDDAANVMRSSRLPTRDELTRALSSTDTRPRDSRPRNANSSGNARKSVDPSYEPSQQPWSPDHTTDVTLTRALADKDPSAVPVGERPRWVADRRFQLEYDLESVGPTGVAKVELWGTRDGGRTWRSFGIDADNRSPFTVNVDGDGIYGFRITVQNRGGSGAPPPHGGDLPEVWIGVDRTRPSAEITAVGPRTTAGQKHLVIHWRADDEHLAPRPITLRFAARPGGPWRPIAAGIPNTGSYDWPLDGPLPDRVYLRLEVRDEAGNLGVFTSANSVPLDAIVPQGRIRGVESAADVSSRLDWPRRPKPSLE